MKRKTIRGAFLIWIGALALGALAGCGSQSMMTLPESAPATTLTPTPTLTPAPETGGGQETQKDSDSLSEGETEEGEAYARSANCFAADLFEALAQESEGKNLLLSPYSVFSALAVLSNGMENSEARDELMDVLYLQEDGVSYDYDGTVQVLALLNSSLQSNSYAQVELANAVWLSGRLTLSPDFSEYASRLNTMQAECFQMDLTSSDTVEAVNAWVDEHTNHMIPQLRDDPYSEQTVLVILNAVYFLGKWSEAFNEALTSEQTFYGVSGEQTVDMMYVNTALEYRNCGGYAYVRLPYQDGEYNMTIYLSETEGVTMPELYQSGALSEKELAALFGTELDDDEIWIREWPNVSLSLPRFELECTSELNAAVAACGAQQIFQDVRATEIFDYDDLGGMAVYVDEIRQKAKIKVEEQGTEAAAVTSIECNTTSLDTEEHVEFTVDEPFMFTITDCGTGVVLFVGIVNEIE